MHFCHQNIVTQWGLICNHHQQSHVAARRYKTVIISWEALAGGRLRTKTLQTSTHTMLQSDGSTERTHYCLTFAQNVLFGGHVIKLQTTTTTFQTYTCGIENCLVPFLSPTRVWSLWLLSYRASVNRVRCPVQHQIFHPNWVFVFLNLSRFAGRTNKTTQNNQYSHNTVAGGRCVSAPTKCVQPQCLSQFDSTAWAAVLKYIILNL